MTIRHVAITYAEDDRPGSRDASGAFIPQAVVFARHWQAQGARVTRLPFRQSHALTKAKRARSVIEPIRALANASSPIDLWVYLGHGLRTSLSSAGVYVRHGDLRSPIYALADALALARPVGAPIRVALMACSAGADPIDPRSVVYGSTGARVPGPGSFAAALAEELRARGCPPGTWVDAHTLAGHATRNPYVVRCRVEAPETEWIVRPDEGMVWDVWRERLDNDRSFRASFSAMTAEKIRAELAAPAVKP